MPRQIDQPTLIEAAGNRPKIIEEYVGRVNSGHAQLSVARMISPEGWVEPGQRPEFEEISLVLGEWKGPPREKRSGAAILGRRRFVPDPGSSNH
jgi:hypothetical protein